MDAHPVTGGRIDVSGEQTPDGAKISAAELERLAVEEVPVAGEMGVVVDSVSPGEVRARVPYRESFLRPGGTVAGPVLMALADFVTWGVVMSLIGPVKLAVTTSLNINFLRKPGPGDHAVNRCDCAILPPERERCKVRLFTR